MENSLEQITWKDVETVELRAGTIVEVEDFPEARKPAYQAIRNIPRKPIATFSSEVLMPAFGKGGRVASSTEQSGDERCAQFGQPTAEI